MSFAELLEANGWDAEDRLTLNRLGPGRRWESVVVRVGDAQGVVSAHLSDCDAWYSVCPVRADLQPRVVSPNGRVRATRGTEADVVGVRALWTDLDVKPDGMPSMEAAREVIEALSQRIEADPSAVVESGHGLHPYWVLDDGGWNWAPGDVQAMARARGALTQWGALVSQEASRLGGAVDSVYDLARVMRVPGSKNMKGVAR